MSSNYSQKLKDPRWQRKRLEALQAADWACQDCKNTRKTLHVHHTRYAGEPWDVPLSSLEVLCEDCHEGRHTPTKPLSIYFAGKIGKGDWRHEIIPDLRGAWSGEECQGGADTKSISPIIWEEGGHTLQCAGPYFVACDHGCYHGTSTHGQIADDSSCGISESKIWWESRWKVWDQCMGWLVQSDVVFCFIDNEGAYGTLCELRANFAKPRAVYFSSEELLKSYWFFVLELLDRGSAVNPIEQEDGTLKIGVNNCPKSAFKDSLPYFSKAVKNL